LQSSGVPRRENADLCLSPMSRIELERFPVRPYHWVFSRGLMAADRIALEAATRLPRKDVPIVVYDAGEGLVRVSK
jgi:hypothetical protein